MMDLATSWSSDSWETGLNWADAVDDELGESINEIKYESTNFNDLWRRKGLKSIDDANLNQLGYTICRDTFLWMVCCEETNKIDPKIHFPKLECKSGQKASQAFIESIDNNEWLLKDENKEYGDGGCYGQHRHKCLGSKCIYCSGQGEFRHACNLCAKKHKSCSRCSGGYINSDKRPELCPNIRINKRCPRCKGKGFYVKKCTGACPMKQHAYIKNGKLLPSCACGRPHRLGDCKPINNQYGKEIKSPYQRIEECADCGYRHPHIYSMKNIAESTKQIINRRPRKQNKKTNDGWNKV